MHARLVIPRTTGSIHDGEGPAWKPSREEEGAVLVLVRCANGHVCYLNHEIDDAGIVTPSIVCPKEDCDWHVVAELGGWPP